jgi:hypothetical protein
VYVKFVVPLRGLGLLPDELHAVFATAAAGVLLRAVVGVLCSPHVSHSCGVDW